MKKNALHSFGHFGGAHTRGPLGGVWRGIEEDQRGAARCAGVRENQLWRARRHVHPTEIIDVSKIKI